MQCCVVQRKSQHSTTHQKIKKLILQLDFLLLGFITQCELLILKYLSFLHCRINVIISLIST